MTHALVCILPYFRIYRYIERGRKQNLQNEICFPHQKEFKCELVFSWHHVILNIYMPLKKEAFSRNHSAMRRCLPVKAIFFLRSSWRDTHPWHRILNMRRTSQPSWREPNQTPLTFYPNLGFCAWVHFKP